jgi:hypothetical protein
MIKELDNQDESPHENTSETGEEAQEDSPAFNNNLDFDADNIEIEQGCQPQTYPDIF